MPTLKTRTVVMNLQQGGAYDIYIGRPSGTRPWRFGNPFVMGVDGDRGNVIDKFNLWLLYGSDFGNTDATLKRRKWILENIRFLKGKTLGCFCAPEECHGDILVRMANES